jgi:hypothetical protein
MAIAVSGLLVLLLGTQQLEQEAKQLQGLALGLRGLVEVAG